jgi:hypothetical protein
MGYDDMRDEGPHCRFVFLRSADRINKRQFGSDHYPGLKFSIRGGGFVMIKSNSISVFHSFAFHFRRGQALSKSPRFIRWSEARMGATVPGKKV